MPPAGTGLAVGTSKVERHRHMTKYGDVRGGGGTHLGGASHAYQRIPRTGVTRADSGNADLYLTPVGQDAILRAYQAGLGVLVSKTSDGGALSLTVYDGETRYREYAGNADEADELWDILDGLTTLKGTPPQPVPQNGQVGPLGAEMKGGSKPTRKIRGTGKGR